MRFKSSLYSTSAACRKTAVLSNTKTGAEPPPPVRRVALASPGSGTSGGGAPPRSLPPEVSRPVAAQAHVEPVRQQVDAPRQEQGVVVPAPPRGHVAPPGEVRDVPQQLGEGAVVDAPAAGGIALPGERPGHERSSRKRGRARGTAHEGPRENIDARRWDARRRSGTPSARALTSTTSGPGPFGGLPRSRGPR